MRSAGSWAGLEAELREYEAVREGRFRMDELRFDRPIFPRFSSRLASLRG